MPQLVLFVLDTEIGQPAGGMDLTGHAGAAVVNQSFCLHDLPWELGGRLPSVPASKSRETQSAGAFTISSW